MFCTSMSIILVGFGDFGDSELDGFSVSLSAAAAVRVAKLSYRDISGVLMKSEYLESFFVMSSGIVGPFCYGSAVKLPSTSSNIVCVFCSSYGSAVKPPSSFYTVRKALVV